MQVDQSGDEVHRLLGVGLAHGLGHVDEAVVQVGAVLDEVGVVGLADHDEAGPVGDLMVIGGEGVLQGVLGAEVVHAHHHAGHAAAVGDFLAGLDVLAVLAGGGQVLAHGLDGLQGQHVAHEVVGVVDVGLRGVEECVEALVSGELGGHGQHEVGVHDGQNGEGVLVAAAHLLLGLLVGHDGPGVQLGAGAGGGGDGDDGQGLILHALAAAGAAVDIIPIVALVGDHHGDGLGCVDAAAAAETDDEVTALGAGKGGPVHDVVQHGVCQDLVEHGVGDPGLGQLVLDDVQVAVGAGGLAGGNDDEGLLAGQALLVQLLDGPLAEDEVGGNVERKAHDQFSFQIHMGRQSAQSHAPHCIMEPAWGQDLGGLFVEIFPEKFAGKFCKLPLYIFRRVCYNNLVLKIV